MLFHLILRTLKLSELITENKVGVIVQDTDKYTDCLNEKPGRIFVKNVNIR